MELIISLLSGAVGGNVAGALMKDKSLGTLGNSVAGILGGGIGGQLLSLIGVGAGGGGLDIGAIIGQVAAGGVGGGVLLVIVGIVKDLLKR